MRGAAPGTRLEARGVTVRAGDRVILNQASLGLGPGELVGLIGPNGAGKSTLVRAMAGILPCTSGDILINGRAGAAIAPPARARLIAYLAQERQVEWPIRVREIVALGRLPFRRGLFGQGLAPPGPADEAMIEACLRRVDAQALAELPARALSGGELARVLLARALAVSAPLLLADEPIAGLDPFQQLQVMEILRQEARRGMGVLVVLHDLALAARFLDRVVVIAGGEVRGDGPPAEVLSPGALEAVYGVIPIAGEHEGQRWLLPWSRAKAG